MKKYSLYLIVLILLMACSEKHQEVLNTKASVQLNDEFRENPLLMHPMTSSVQPKDSRPCMKMILRLTMLRKI